MPGGFLHVLQQRAVLKRRGDECRPHRVRRISSRLSDQCRVFPDHAVDGVRAHRAADMVLFPVVVEGPEQRTIHITAVSGSLYIEAKPCGGLGVDRQRIASASLAGDAKGIKAPVLVQVAHGQRRDLGAAQTHLQTHGQDGAVARALYRRLVGQVEHLAGFGLGEGKRRAFFAIDRGPFDLGHWILFGEAVPDKVFEQTR